MNLSNCLQIIPFLLLISALRLIESAAEDLTRHPSLCYEDSERLVRTPYGYRCVVTRRLNEKRSTDETELSAQDSDLNDSNSDVNNKIKDLSKEEDLNSVVPIVEPMALSAKYRKIVIKNNRGPWKIANMIFKRSPQSDTAQVGQSGQLFGETQVSKMDGLLVSKHFSNDSNIESLSPKPAIKGLKSTETGVPLLTESSVEEKFIRNLPKINLFAKTVNKSNLRNFKFSSDIDVIDLMEEDSVLRSRSFDHNKTFVVNLLSADKRKTRSPQFSDKSTAEDAADQLKNDDKSEEPYTPIRIFVFLNRNKNKERDHRIESSENRMNIARTPQPRRASFQLKADSLRTSTSTTTTSTTTTTPKTTTTSIPIKRVLKTLDLNEFEDRMSSELLNDDIENKTEEDSYVEPTEDSYVEPTEASIGELFSLTSAPISRKWSFVCGKRRGFFADIENDCRTYYQCSVRGRQRWECPPGTRFNQFSSTCDWLENVNCLSFKDLINEKTAVGQDIDITTAPTPTQAIPRTSTSTTTTPSYESDYEDAFEE